MLIVFDIGNTNVVVGGFKGDELVFEFRLKTDTGRTVDEYAASLLALLDRRLGGGWKFSGCMISSVVPPLTPLFVRLVEEQMALKPLIVGPGIKTGMPIRTVDPSAVGADRIVNALAAKLLFGCPALVVDFGTATSFDYVSSEGAYEGGVIAPGLQIALESLASRTAKLPLIEISWPASVIGKSTVSAMQVGSVVGYVCMVDGLIDNIEREVGPIEHIISTGGIGKLISAHSTRIRSCDPYLTLKGMRLMYELNR